MSDKYNIRLLLDLRDQFGDPLPGTNRLLEDSEIEVSYVTSREGNVVEPSDLDGVDAAISMIDDIDASSLETAESLELVVRAGAGHENLDVDALTNEGVIAAHAAQGPTQSVAQATVGMIITCAHNLKKFDHLVRTDPEEAILNKANHMGHELQNQTLGVIGLGQIGKKVVELIRPFGPDVRVYDPYLEEEKARSLGIAKSNLDTLLEESDIISLHVPLTEETEYMLGMDELRQMKETAFLINTSRGKIYKDTVLADALREGEIRGAAIDVFENEAQLGDNPLREIDTALLTPHISGITHEAIERIFSICVDSVLCMKNDELPKNILNPEAVKTTEVPEERLSPAYIP
jgi:D-3-phosphoglycerate dehydrogenase